MNLNDLLDARCRGRWDVFDETDDPETVEFALNLCASCPALDACRAYFDALPPRRRPPGVIAGRVNHRNDVA